MHLSRSDDSSLRLKVKLALAVVVIAGVAACAGSGSGGEAEAVADDAAMAAARVFFVTPVDDTDHPTEVPLALTFGVEHFEIGAVPEEVTFPREGLGHFHLGFNTECLPVGELIPKADPWAHLGDGSDGMEMQLEAGEYRFSVQVGDDEHRTIEGLCETITIRMEDGI